MKRGSMPTRQKIADYWTNTDEGQERIRQIKESYKIDVTNLACIDRDIAHCWACNKTIRSGSTGYNVPDLGLQRCHVIPHSLGGSNHPSNLILMCSPCHAASPDTNEELYFWKWFSRVRSHLQNEMRALQDFLDTSSLDLETASQLNLNEMLAYLEKSSEGIEVTTHGPTIAQGTRFVLVQKAVDLMSQDYPAEKEEQ